MDESTSDESINEIQVTAKPSKAINANAQFNSYEEFVKLFNEYCEASYQTYNVTDSRVNDANDKQFKYKYVVYKCQLHADPDKIKTKSKGLRPVQSYTGCICLAEMRLVLTQSKKDKIACYKFTKFNMVHNHPLEEDVFKVFPKNRRLDKEQQEKIVEDYTISKHPMLIAAKMREKTGKCVTAKDVLNIVQASKIKSLPKEAQTDENQEVEAVIQEQIQKDGHDFFEIATNEDRTKLIIYQTDQMREI
jgi:hypothetical protein